MMWVLLAWWVANCALLGGPIGRLSLRGEKRPSVSPLFGLVASHLLQWAFLVLLVGWLPPGGALVGTLAAGSVFGGGLWLWSPPSRTAFPLPVVSKGLAFTVAASALLAGLLGFRTFTVGYMGLDPEALFSHTAFVGWMSRAGFPPTNPLEPDHLLRYRLGLHLLAAGFSDASGALPGEALAAAVGLASAMLLPAVVGISVGLTGSFVAGLAAAVMAFMGGSLLPWARLVQLATSGSQPDWLPSDFFTGRLWGGNTFDMLHKNPSIAVGLAVFGISLWLYFEVLRTQQPRPMPLILASAGLAVLGMVNEVYFVALCVGGALYVGVLAVPGVRWNSLASGLIPMVAAVALVAARGGLMAGLSIAGDGSSSLRMAPNLEHLGQVVTPPGSGADWVPLLSFESLLDTDLLLLGLPSGLVLAWLLRSSYLGVGFSAALAAFVMWTAIYSQAALRDGYRFGQAALSIYMLLLPLLAFEAFRSRRPLGSRLARWLACTAAILAVIPHLFAAGWVATSAPSDPTLSAGSPDRLAAEHLRASKTTWRVLVPLDVADDDYTRLYRPDGPPAAMRAVLGFGGHAVPTGHVDFFNQQSYLGRYREASHTFNRAALETLGIDWVYMLPASLSADQRANLAAAVGRGDLVEERRFGTVGTDSERVLYRFVGRGTGGGDGTPPPSAAGQLCTAQDVRAG